MRDQSVIRNDPAACLARDITIAVCGRPAALLVEHTLEVLAGDADARVDHANSDCLVGILLRQLADWTLRMQRSMETVPH
jgi:hypothetical protein